MDTGNLTDTSTGKESSEIRTLAKESEKEESPSTPAQTKPVSDNSLETLAELLSLIQEDCRRYRETLAEYMPNKTPVAIRFDGDGIIYLASPPGHRLDTGKGHILLDGKPVTGWTLAKKDTGK